MGDIIVIGIIIIISLLALKRVFSNKKGCSSCPMAKECSKKNRP